MDPLQTRSIYWLVQGPSHEDCGVISRAARTDQKHDVLAALHLRLHLLEIVLTVHRLLIDFQDDIAAAQSHGIAEAVGLQVLHNDALGTRQLVAVGHVWCDAAHGDAELAFLRLGLLAALLLLAQACGKQLGTVSNGDVRRRGLPTANIADFGGASRLDSGNLGHQFIARLHLPAIDGNDGVARLQTSLVSRTVRRNVSDGDATGNPIDAGHRRIRHGVELHSNRAARNFVLRSDELVVHLHHGIGRHRETDALVSSATGVNGSVDADHLARHVDQRTARIARIDGRVGLDERLKLPVGNDIASFGGNDTGGDRLIETEWTSHRKHPVADRHAVRVAQLGCGQRLLGVNLDDREIGFLVNPNHDGVVGHGGGIVHQLYVDAIGFLDHVIVGHDVALGVDDDAGTQGALAQIVGPKALVRTSLAALATKKAVEEVLERTVFVAATRSFLAGGHAAAATVRVLDRRFGADVDHRRLHLASDLGKLVRKLPRRGNL